MGIPCAFYDGDREPRTYRFNSEAVLSEAPGFPGVAISSST
jgi:hypothetical protein